MHNDHPPPVDRLLTLGRPGWGAEWLDYRALGLGEEHVPALLALLAEIHWDAWEEDDDETPFWAPLHAWRALGQLRAQAAVEPLLAFMLRNAETDDWMLSEAPRVLGMIGPAALGPVRRELVRAARGAAGREEWGAGSLSEAVAQIGMQHPECRDAAVEALTRQLRLHRDQDEALNGFLVASLVDLRAVEAAPVMAEAFGDGSVDESILGDWEDVQVALGLLAERTTPARPYVLVPRRSPPAPAPLPPNEAARARSLRKAQKQARRKKRGRR